MFERLLMVCSICLVVGSMEAIEISSKIDFDSKDATGESHSSSNDQDTVIIVVESSNDDDRKEIGGSVSSRSRARVDANVRGPVKPMISQRNCPLNPREARPRMIKNVNIIVNGGTTVKPENFNCRNGICETILSTETDKEGNVVASVRLTVVTNTKDEKIVDVPVIDGLRGTGYENRNPTLGVGDGRDAPYPTFYDNNIPKAPANRKDRIPWRNPSRPQSPSFHPRNSGSRHEVPVWMPRIPTRGSVDDKIEAPLSRTNPQ